MLIYDPFLSSGIIGSGAGAKLRDKILRVPSTEVTPKEFSEAPGISFAEADKATKDKAIENQLLTNQSAKGNTEEESQGSHLNS